jgi:hypothetical protein
MYVHMYVRKLHMSPPRYLHTFVGTLVFFFLPKSDNLEQRRPFYLRLLSWLSAQAGLLKLTSQDLTYSGRVTSGRCYDHNFLRFLTIFGKKMAFFLNTNVMINFFSKFSFVLSQKRQFFRKIFRRKYLKNHNIGPRWVCEKNCTKCKYVPPTRSCHSIWITLTV